MQLRAHVKFDELERETFNRALSGHAHALEDEPRDQRETQYLPVKVFLNRIVEHHDLLNLTELEELESVLLRLIRLWTPQTTVRYWQQVAPQSSGEDALAGLARERQLAIIRVNEALELTLRAQRIANAHALVASSWFSQEVPA